MSFGDVYQHKSNSDQVLMEIAPSGQYPSSPDSIVLCLPSPGRWYSVGFISNWNVWSTDSGWTLVDPEEDDE